MDLSSLIDILCTGVNLKVSAIVVYDLASKVLDTEVIPQHNIAGLISSITLLVLFSQEKPLR